MTGLEMDWGPSQSLCLEPGFSQVLLCKQRMERYDGSGRPTLGNYNVQYHIQGPNTTVY